MARANNLGFAGRLGVGLFIGGCAAVAAAQPLDRGADALLAIDQHRGSVVEGIVATWGAPLAQSSAYVSIDELRMRLQGLRADRLLAVSLAGTLDGVREIIGAGSAPVATAKPGLLQAKSLGDLGIDVTYTPITPCRLVETRGTFAAVYQGDGTPAHTPAPFTAGQVRSYTVQGGNGACLAQLPSALNPAAVQLQVFGMPTTTASGDIEILPQGAALGSTATMVYIASIAFNTVSTSARINPANNQISVQVRGGGANLAIDVVGYFRRSGNYQGTHTITGIGAADGGGGNNIVSGDYATVAGGFLNTASNLYATVAGGLDNAASGFGATVAGGAHNIASGVYSIVAGQAATAGEDGMFVWSDSKPFGFNPVAYRPPGQSANTFNVRATGIGGVFFVTGIDTTTGFPTSTCYVQNLGGWNCTSDRNVKRNLRPVDTGDVLAKVVALPIYHWQPKEGPNRDVEHLGPMAQDFKAGFALGNDDKSIGSQDADGVALAAIQGLHRLVQEKDAKVEALKRDVSRLQSLQDEMAQLRAVLNELRSSPTSLAVGGSSRSDSRTAN